VAEARSTQQNASALCQLAKYRHSASLTTQAAVNDDAIEAVIDEGQQISE
jgi:hypothetical protein